MKLHAFHRITLKNHIDLLLMHNLFKVLELIKLNTVLFHV